MQELWEVTPALPAPTAPQEVAQLSVLGSLAQTMRARSSAAKDRAAEHRELRNGIVGMQHNQPEWQTQLPGEMNETVRRQGETAQNATRVLQHQGGCMYEFQEECVRRTLMSLPAMCRCNGSRVSTLRACLVCFRAADTRNLYVCRRGQFPSDRNL